MLGSVFFGGGKMFDIENLRRELFTLQDEAYRNFQAKIIPNVDREKFIGIRTPELCRMKVSTSTNRHGGE